MAAASVSEQPVGAALCRDRGLNGGHDKHGRRKAAKPATHLAGACEAICCEILPVR